jgi:hypothetical protein
MTTTTTEPRLWPDGPIGASLALGGTTRHLDDEDSYLDITRGRLASLALALEQWTPDRPDAGAVVLRILDDMGRDHAIMRKVAAREHELRTGAD